jgi:hypothetical protein
LICDALFLPLLFAWGTTPSKPDPDGFPPKKLAPERGSGYAAVRFHPICQQYITFSAKINGFRAESMPYTAVKWLFRELFRTNFARG